MIVGRLQPAAHGEARGELTFHEVTGIFAADNGVRVPLLILCVPPEVLVGKHVVGGAVLREGIRRFKRSAVESVLRTVWIRIVIDEVLNLLLPFAPKPGGTVWESFTLQRVRERQQEQFIVKAELIGLVIVRKDAVGVVKEGFGRAVCAPQVTGRIEVGRHPGIPARNLIHMEVEHDDVRVIV